MATLHGFTNSLYICLVCKAPVRAPMCHFCRDGLLGAREPFVRDEKIYRIRSLFSWRESSPPALKWLVHSLKRHDEPELWRELAAWMLMAFGPRQDSVLVPIPSRQRNHALGLTRAIERLTGIPIKQALAPPEEDRHQKRLSRERRNEVYFERALWSFCTEYTNVIIVDDVVTTGATSRAAYHALGRPRNCEVWCLMDRRPCRK